MKSPETGSIGSQGALVRPAPDFRLKVTHTHKALPTDPDTWLVEVFKGAESETYQAVAGENVEQLVGSSIGAVFTGGRATFELEVVQEAPGPELGSIEPEPLKEREQYAYEAQLIAEWEKWEKLVYECTDCRNQPSWPCYVPEDSDGGFGSGASLRRLCAGCQTEVGAHLLQAPETEGG